MTEGHQAGDSRASVLPRPSWFTRYRETVESDYYGRRVFRFHRRVPEPAVECLDVLLAVSVAVAVLALSGSLRFEVDHVELYLRPEDAYRLGDELHCSADWPAWGKQGRCRRR